MSHRAVTLGVISDTHCPKRLKALPDAVFDVFRGVDMIVHAGDVGDLRVLDQLSRIAPVVAVHGNDESPEAATALPYLQIVTAAEQRVLLTHGHFTDPIMEAAQRSDDSWTTTFARWASHAQEHHASVMIYGHSHIPSVTQYGGVWLVNPGALASANVMTRQTVKTVARVMLSAGKPPFIVHYDLAHPDVPHVPPHDYEAGFADFYARYTASIFAPDLYGERDWIRDELAAIAGAEVIYDALLPLAHEVWDGRRDFISTEDAVNLWKAHSKLPHGLLDKLQLHPLFSQYL